jgi:uncharacterized repeat protein (TIGR03803 family)
MSLRVLLRAIFIPVLLAVMVAACAGQTFSSLADFVGSNGSGPYTAPLVQGRDGNFYGTTSYGGTNCAPYGCGTIFKITPAGVLTTLYSFCDEEYCPDGNTPDSGLVLGSDGNFYGTTTQGGASDEHGGTVFKVTPAGQLTTLYSFCQQSNCTDGSFPIGGLIQGTDGNFYGTTFSGGTGDAQYCDGGCGSIFKLTPAGVLTTLHTFAGYPVDGSGPSAGLLQAANSKFYGTTTNGGAYLASCVLGCGTVFEFASNGSYSEFYSFGGYTGDAAAPHAPLAIGNDGAFYGTGLEGGSEGAGSIFRITASGSESLLYSFCSQSNCDDGQLPYAGLSLGTDRNFYGATEAGGAYTAGSIFRITSKGDLTTLYSFCSDGYPHCPDGAALYAGVVQGTSGAFYGLTNSGGGTTGSDDGTVFKLSVDLGDFVKPVESAGKVGASIGILGSFPAGVESVSFNGAPANGVTSTRTFLIARVPAGATSGYITVTESGRTLQSNVPFHVIQ